MMLEIYARFYVNKASKQELEEVNKQFRDLLKTVGLGTIFIFPGGMITLPLTLVIAKRMGVDLIPSSFKKKPLINQALEQDPNVTKPLL